MSQGNEPDDERFAALREQSDRLQVAQARLWAVLAGLGAGLAGVIVAYSLIVLPLRLAGTFWSWVVVGCFAAACAAVAANAAWRYGRRTAIWQSGVCCRKR